MPGVLGGSAPVGKTNPLRLLQVRGECFVEVMGDYYPLFNLYHLKSGERMTIKRKTKGPSDCLIISKPLFLLGAGGRT